MAEYYEKLNSRISNEYNYTLEFRIIMTQHILPQWMFCSEYNFSNIANYQERAMYKFKEIYSSNKITIGDDNVVKIIGELQSFNDQERQMIKLLIQNYRKLSLNILSHDRLLLFLNNPSIDTDEIITTLFKLYEESKEYITHLYIQFDEYLYSSINLNNLYVGLEFLSITPNNYMQETKTLDFNTFENYPPALKTLIIKYPGKYNICPEKFNYGLETLVLENVKYIPQFCNLPPTVKNLFIKFYQELDSQRNFRNIKCNDRDFVNDFANVPNSLENLVYYVEGNITNIDFTILPKTMKTIDIRCIGIEDNIKKNYEKMEEELKQHAPECLLNYYYKKYY